MHQHLLHQPVEKVLFLWVGALGHHLFEVLHDGCKHLPVDGRELQPLPPGLKVPPLGLKLFHLCVEFLNPLGADLGFHGLGLEGLEVAFDGRPDLGHLGFDLFNLLLHVRFLRAETAVGLRPDAGHKLLVTEHGLNVFDHRRFQELGPHVVLFALMVVEALGADVVRDGVALLAAAGSEHVRLVAIYRENEFIPNPSPDTRLLPGSVLLLMGRKEQIKKAFDLLQRKMKEPASET